MARRNRKSNDESGPGLFDTREEAQKISAPTSSTVLISGSLDPFDLNEDQRKALDLRVNRVISASAGTGKTHTITALYLALLEGRLAPGGVLLDEKEWLDKAAKNALNPMRPAEIVAVTFTQKAADELLERTRAGLDHELAKPGLPQHLREHLIQCRKDLFSAPVSTIHGFCARLLREAGASGPVPPGFKVLEEEEVSELYESALSSAAAEMLASKQFSEFELMAQQHGLFKPSGVINVGRRLLNALRTSGASVSTFQKGPALSLNQIEQELATFYSAILSAPKYRGKEPSQKLKDICAAKKVPASLEETRARALELQSGIYNQNGDLYKWAENAGIDDPFPKILQAAHAPYVNALAEYVQRVEKEFSAAKRKAGGLDYDDLLLNCKQLLCTDGKRSQPRYKFVLIDEYQDTNPLQREIMFAAAFPGDCEKTEPRLGLVGDIKQSIYRFRGADVSLMREAERDFGQMPLRQNFRSRGKVIDLINSFFKHVWPGNAGGMHYGESHELRAGGEDARHAWDKPAGELICWDPDDGNAAEKRQRQAFAAARRIRLLLAPEKTSLSQPVIWDKKTKQPRSRIRYGDIAILARSIKSLRGSLQVALSKYRIPFRMLGGVSFFTRQECLDVLNLWAAACDETDSFAAAGVLRSPFIGMSDAGMWAILNWDSQNSARSNLVEKILRAAREMPRDRLSANDAACLDIAARLFQRLQDWRGRRTAVEILDWALTETGFLSVLAMQPRGEMAVAAVRKLIEIARGFEAKGNRHLSDLVRWLKTQADAEWVDAGDAVGKEFSSDPGSEDDAVQIGTVHSAKGLEFPIVILADAGHKIPPLNNWALYTPENGLGLKLGEPFGTDTKACDAIYSANAALERQRDDEERLRLLYVALTRTRDYLIVMGECGNSKEETNWRRIINDFRRINPDVLSQVDARCKELREVSHAADAGLLQFSNGTVTVRDEYAKIETPESIVPDLKLQIERSTQASREISVGVSRLALWLWCPRRAAFATWQNERAAKMVDPDMETAPDENDDEGTDEPNPDIRALGTAVHAALEALFGEAGSAEVAAQRFSRALLEAGVRESEQTKAVFHKAMALGNSDWGKRAAKLPQDRRWVETPFRWRAPQSEHGRVTLKGQIDLLLNPSPGKWEIIDYKLAELGDHGRESEAVTRYAWQAGIYALVAAQILNVPVAQVESSLIFLRDEVVEPQTLKTLGHAQIALPTLSAVINQFAACRPDANPLALPAQVWRPAHAAPQARTPELCKAHRCPFVKHCYGAK